MKVQLEGFDEVSSILSAGVYALVKNGVVIYVGKAKGLYSRIYTHRTQANRASKGQNIPTWLPVKGFVFDQVFIRPCHPDQLDNLEYEMINKYKPRYNESLKNGLKVKSLTTIKVGSTVIELNKTETINRRI